MRQSAFSILFLSSLFLLGCADYAKVEVANIETLSLETNADEKINHGSSFNIEVFANLKNGSKENITNHPDLKIKSDALLNNWGNNYQVIDRPLSFSDTTYKVSLLLQGEGVRIGSNEQVSLNYSGGISIESESLDGKNGKTQRKGGVTLFSRDGVDGKPGQDGQTGQDGGNYTAYLWVDQDEVRLRMENDSTGIIWKYKSRSCDSIIIDISGGQGGNGSQGGEGGNGKDGKGVKLPGNGGNGANGGNAGAGGNGGSILLFVHANAKHLIPKIYIIRLPGYSGTNGIGGMGGVSGKAIKGQARGTSGQSGQSGLPATSGVEGPKPVISIINFDYFELN